MNQMKKWIALFLSLALLLTCTAVLAEEKAAEPRVAHYQIRNLTGDGIFFLTLTDNQTGEVLELLGEGEVIPVDGIFFLNLNADESETDESLEHRYTLSFSNGGEDVYEFKTLSFENVLIDLLAADAMTGATPIKFNPKMFQVGNYQIINKTDKVLESVTFTENADPNNNSMVAPMIDPEGSETVSFCIAPENEPSHALTVEFRFADGTTCSFGTLSIEDASMTLTTDTISGATPFTFGPLVTE